MSKGFRIQTPRELAQWQASMSGVKVTPDMIDGWGLMVDLLFANTQRVVHVWPVNGGSLKSSGRSSVKSTSDVVTGEVEYGSSSVPYALFEMARGGQHDYMQRGFEMTRPVMEAEVGRIAFEGFLRQVKGD